MKVEVTDLIPPIISLDETGDGFILETGEEYVFKPEIANKEGLKLSWEIDGEEVSTADEYAFSSQQEGNFSSFSKLRMMTVMMNTSYRYWWLKRCR